MNVLSCCDGMSCAQIALDKLGIKVDNYFASEIDKYAIKVTQQNYPGTKQLGNLEEWKNWKLPKIDLMAAGTPCQDLTRLKTEGKGLEGIKSKLFYDFADALDYFKPKYFFLENVMMDDLSNEIISKRLGVDPILIDSGDFSAQNRQRLYWTNIHFDTETPKSELVLEDIMETEVDEKYYYNLPYFKNDDSKRVIANMKTHKGNGKRIFTDLTSRVYNPYHKCATLTAVAGGHQEKKVMDHKGIRKLTPLEYERLQTVPEGYTNCVSNSQRYKMLGNGWTVDVIAHMFKGLKEM